MKFYTNANLITYKGNWHSEVSNQYLDNPKDGDIALKIERYFNKVTSSEKIFVTYRIKLYNLYTVDPNYNTTGVTIYQAIHS